MILTRYLGIDPGERRIGVALSDPLGIIAQPHTVLDRRHSSVLEEIRAMCVEYGVGTVVIGLATSLTGAEGSAAERARELGDEVAGATGCEVVFFDERFTTVQAEAALLEGGMKRRKRRETVDKVAAAVMLQGYLDWQARHDS